MELKTWRSPRCWIKTVTGHSQWTWYIDIQQRVNLTFKWQAKSRTENKKREWVKRSNNINLYLKWKNARNIEMSTAKKFSADPMNLW